MLKILTSYQQENIPIRLMDATPRPNIYEGVIVAVDDVGIVIAETTKRCEFFFPWYSVKWISLVKN